MPNWCQNSLIISHHDNDMIERFAIAFEEDRTCQTFVAMPEGYKESGEWYDWSIANWGTKWDFGLTNGDMSRVGNTIYCNFETAWAPPVELYEKLYSFGFSVHADYREEGIGFVGTWVDGQETFQRTNCW